MPPNQPESRVLTKRYRFALLLVALLSVLSQLLIRGAVERGEQDAALVNVAGRQRMLSQRLSKAALELHRPTVVGAISEDAEEELRQSLRVWESSHEALKRRNHEGLAEGSGAADIEGLLRATEKPFQAMRRAAQELIDASQATPRNDAKIRTAENEILRTEGEFLRAMERVVGGYQRVAERKLSRLQAILWGLTALTLLVLLLEAKFVFEPAAEQIDDSFGSLRATQHALQRNQAELESKVAERTEEIAAQERQFRAIFENASVGVAQVDLGSGRFMRVNPALCRLLRCEESELVGRTFAEITYPEDRARDLEALARLVAGEAKGYQARKRYVRSDGRTVWVEVSVTLMRDEAGRRPDRTVTVIQDISTQVEAEQALRSSEEHFRLLAEEAPQMFWIADERLRVEYFSSRWYEYTGLTPQEPLALAWLAQVHPEDRAGVEQALAAALEQGQSFSVEHRLRSHAGTFHWCLSRAHPLHGAGVRRLRWFGTITDIEEQKRNQFAAEDESRSKDEFVALVIHELRTPLTAMLGWTTILRQRGPDPALLSRALEVIEQNARMQSRLIEDLLDMARIINGKLDMEREPVDLVQALNSAVDTVRPNAERKQIELAVVVPSTPCRVLADPRRLQQILWNLLSNAIKFTQRGGQITARVERLDALTVSISDNGSGISPDMLPHVFERFQQARRSTDRSQGLGLGLAIVKHLVEAHQGSIVASSNGEGRGSCFTVRLPCLVEGVEGELPG